MELLAPPALSVASALPEDFAGPATPFAMADFRACWQRNLGPKFGVLASQGAAIIRRKGFLRGMLGLRELTLCGHETAWYQSPDPSDVHHLLHLAARQPWDTFRLLCPEGLPEQALGEFSARYGPILSLPLNKTYAIDLSEGFEAYLASRSRNFRKDINRKLRLAEPLNPELVQFEGASAIEPFFESFFAAHIPYWQQRTGNSYFSDPRERAFIVSWARGLQAEGRLILDGLRLGGEIANLGMTVRHETPAVQDQYWMLTINTGAHAEVSPGLVALTHRLQQAAANGVRRFHMGPGDYRYKVQAANHEEWLVVAVLSNPASLAGRGYLRWLRQSARHPAPEAAQAAE